MTALVWDATGEKVYEGGIDRGVLYIQNVGVAWNGLLSVDDNTSDEVSPVHFDGFKVRNLFSIGDFQATLSAYTYPDEFLSCDGIQRYQDMYIDGQPPTEFSLCYRTMVGDDVRGNSASYKIHLLYNLTAVADSTTYATLSMDPEPIEFSWTMHSRPELVTGYRPAAHFIFDSKLWTPERLKSLEEILYGSDQAHAMLPTGEELMEIVSPLHRLIIRTYPNAEWVAIDMNNDHITRINHEVFELTAPTVITLSADQFEASTYITKW